MRIRAGDTGRSSMSTWGLHINLGCRAGVLPDQKARRADPALAEMKVVADPMPLIPRPLDQVMVNEILRSPGRALSKVHNDGARERRSSQQPQLSGLVGKPELRAIRTEKSCAGAVRRHRQRRPAVGAPHLQGSRNNSAVAGGGRHLNYPWQPRLPWG